MTRGILLVPFKKEESQDILTTLNLKLPDFTFGTYRTVDEVSPPAGSECDECDKEAAVAREYRDSTVWFGIAFRTSDSETVNLCRTCSHTTDIMLEDGWLADNYD